MKSQIITTTTMLIGTSHLALAAGIEQGYQDPTAAARGNAYVATADNPSAVHYNPAGLVWQDGVSAQSVTYVSRADIEHSGGSGSFNHNQAIPSGALFLNYSGLADNKLALGLGVTIPFGLGIEFDETYPLRTLGYDATLEHLVISPAISYKINDKLSLGATLTYAHDDYEAKRGIIVPGDSFKFKGSGKGWGYSIGALYRPNEQWSLGATYRSSIKTDINGTSTTNATFPVSFNFSEDASTNFDYPQQLIIGAAYKLNDKWSFETNVQWTDWTSFDEGILTQATGNLTEILDYQDTILIGVGAANKINETTTVNYGYMFSTPAAPARTYSPFVTNSEIHVFSAGVDHTINKLKLSATLLYVHGRERTITGSTTNPISGVNADGDWNVTGVSALLGATYSF